jgi:regulatory protein
MHPRMPAGERMLDPETRLQHAHDVAWRLLDRRDRTAAELRGKLADKRVEPDLIERVVGQLVQSGYLNDARYAQRFAEDRRRLDGWGPERIERRLRSLGLDQEHISAAVSEQEAGADMAAALELLERRFPAAPETPRERDRALGVLVRKGYGPELAYEALRRHAGILEPD